MTNLTIAQDSIQSILIPAGWQECAVPDHGFAMYRLRQFLPAGATNDDISMNFFNRGLALDDDTAGEFLDILAKPLLILDMDQVEALEYLFDEVADPARFSINMARTVAIDGRHVICMEGRWINSKIGMTKLYIDIKGDGRFVQEVSYSAPIGDYQKHRAELIKCMQSIIWKARN